MQHLQSTALFSDSTFAVADSSVDALAFCRRSLASGTASYRVDLMDLAWSERWDVTFVLDVLEHLPDDAGALREVHKALSPGGYCVLTVPALEQFWSWNDEIVGHQRRYSVAALSQSLRDAGFRVVDARYFMFLLSPLLYASRLASGRRIAELTAKQRWELVERSHSVPVKPVNQLLRWVFNLETPLGHRIHFPWGTSVFAVAQKVG